MKYIQLALYGFCNKALAAPHAQRTLTHPTGDLKAKWTNPVKHWFHKPCISWAQRFQVVSWNRVTNLVIKYARDAKVKNSTNCEIIITNSKQPFFSCKKFTALLTTATLTMTTSTFFFSHLLLSCVVFLLLRSSFCRACAFTNRKVFQLNDTRAFLAIRYLNASDSLLCSTHSQCAYAWLTASITITNFKNIFIAKELMGFSVCRAPLKATPPFRYCVRHLRAGNTFCSCRSCMNLLNNGRAAHTRIYIFHPKLFFVVFRFFPLQLLLPLHLNITFFR